MAIHDCYEWSSESNNWVIREEKVDTSLYLYIDVVREKNITSENREEIINTIQKKLENYWGNSNFPYYKVKYRWFIDSSVRYYKNTEIENLPFKNAGEVEEIEIAFLIPYANTYQYNQTPMFDPAGVVQLLGDKENETDVPATSSNKIAYKEQKIGVEQVGDMLNDSSVYDVTIPQYKIRDLAINGVSFPKNNINQEDFYGIKDSKINNIKQPYWGMTSTSSKIVILDENLSNNTPNESLREYTLKDGYLSCGSTKWFVGPRAKLKTYRRVSNVSLIDAVDNADSILYFGEFKPESNSDTDLNNDEQFHLDRRNNGKVPKIKVEWVYHYQNGYSNEIKGATNSTTWKSLTTKNNLPIKEWKIYGTYDGDGGRKGTEKKVENKTYHYLDHRSWENGAQNDFAANGVFSRVNIEGIDANKQHICTIQANGLARLPFILHELPEFKEQYVFDVYINIINETGFYNNSNVYVGLGLPLEQIDHGAPFLPKLVSIVGGSKPERKYNGLWNGAGPIFVGSNKLTQNIGWYSRYYSVERLYGRANLAVFMGLNSTGQNLDIALTSTSLGDSLSSKPWQPKDLIRYCITLEWDDEIDE